MSTEEDRADWSSRLVDAYSCFDELQRILSNGFNNNRPRKRLRSAEKVSGNEGDEKVFKQVKDRWAKILRGLVESPAKQRLFVPIINNLMWVLCTSKKKYRVNDEKYRQAIECIMKPLIGDLMDEKEINEKGHDRQNKRKFFIQRMLDYKSIDESDSQDEVDICSIGDSASQMTANLQTPSGGSANEVSQAALDQGRQRRDEEILQNSCTPEAILLLDMLFDAITIFSKKITEKYADTFAHIYHIINITHVIDLITDKLKEIRRSLQAVASLTEMAVAQQHRSIMMDAFGRYEEIMSRNYELFDSSNPLKIFRHDLRCLIIQVLVIRTMLLQ